MPRSSPSPDAGTSSRRPTTTPTTSGPSVPTSSPGRCSPPTGLGLFPMPLGDSARLVLPAAARRSSRSTASRPSRSLRRAARRYEIRVDTAFAEVIRGCARPGDARELDRRRDRRRVRAPARARLGALGRGVGRRGLAGGLYGVALGGLFAAESMFSRADRRVEGGVRRARRALRGAGDAGAARCSTSSG